MTTPDPQPTSPLRKRRWHQFSLRTLMIVMLLASIGLSWLAVKLQQARRQRAAVEALAGISARVNFSHGPMLYEQNYFVYDSSRGDENPSGPLWLRSIVGNDLFDRVTGVHFSKWTTDDASLIHLKYLPGIECVYLENTHVTDDALAALEDITSLRALFLTSTGIGDHGLSYLRNLTSLETLDLGETQVTDEGLRCLVPLKNLRVLCLEGTKITDAGLMQLTQLSSLEEVHLWGVAISEHAVGQLQIAMPGLKIVRERQHRAFLGNLYLFNEYLLRPIATSSTYHLSSPHALRLVLSRRPARMI